MLDSMFLDCDKSKPFLDILIPTFNRESFLRNNLESIKKCLLADNLNRDVRILISDNASSDGTSQMLEQFQEHNEGIKVMYWNQSTNLGLESNAIFLLSKSEAKYVMYLGDDDYLPADYIRSIINILKQQNFVCIIPGFSALYADGSLVPSRTAPFREKVFVKGFTSVLKVSHFGHQLSGIVFLRDGVYEAYMHSPEYRNIYPFIFFVAFNLQRGAALYAPKFQVLVSQSNSKDWKYDESGLLKDIVKNYSALFGFSSLKKSVAEIVFMMRQSWRLRISFRKPSLMADSFCDLISSKELHILSKIVLPFLYLLIIVKRIVKRSISLVPGKK